MGLYPSENNADQFDRLHLEESARVLRSNLLEPSFPYLISDDPRSSTVFRPSLFLKFFEHPPTHNVHVFAEVTV